MQSLGFRNFGPSRVCGSLVTRLAWGPCNLGASAGIPLNIPRAARITTAAIYTIRLASGRTNPMPAMHLALTR